MKARRRVVVFKCYIEACAAYTEASLDETFEKRIIHECVGVCGYLLVSMTSKCDYQANQEEISR